MSRSRRKRPICGVTTAASDKACKVAAHRQARAAIRSALAHASELPHRRTFGDPWEAAKDGKAWHGWGSPHLMRK